MTIRYEMTNLTKGELAARVDTVSVMFDLEARKAAPLTDAMREAASAYLLPGD